MGISTKGSEGINREDMEQLKKTENNIFHFVGGK